MKLWELESVCRSQPWLLERLTDRPEWTVYADSYRDFAELVRRQDREKLDAELPDEACRHVLGASRTEYYEADGYLRTRRHTPADRVITPLEIFNRYGGHFLEDVTEAGLARVPPPEP